MSENDTIPKKSTSQINKAVFFTSALLIFLLVAFAAVFPDVADKNFKLLQQQIFTNASWFYILAVALILLSRYFSGVTAVTFALPAARTAWRTTGIAGITQEREWPDSGDGGDGERQIYHAGGDGWLSQSTCRCAYSDAGRSCGISLFGELHATTRNAAVTAATTGKMRMGFSLLYFC